MLRVLGEAETGENAGSSRRRPMGIDGIQPFVDFADAVGILGVLGFRKQLRALGGSGEHGLEGRRRAPRRFLRDIADARA